MRELNSHAGHMAVEDTGERDTDVLVSPVRHDCPSLKADYSTAALFAA